MLKLKKKATALKLKVNELLRHWDMGVFRLCSLERVRNNFSRWTRFHSRHDNRLMFCLSSCSLSIGPTARSILICIYIYLYHEYTSGFLWDLAWNLWEPQHGNRKTYTNTSASRFGWAQVLDSRNPKIARRRTWDWWQTVTTVDQEACLKIKGYHRLPQNHPKSHGWSWSSDSNDH